MSSETWVDRSARDRRIVITAEDIQRADDLRQRVADLTYVLERQCTCQPTEQGSSCHGLHGDASRYEYEAWCIETGIQPNFGPFTVEDEGD